MWIYMDFLGVEAIARVQCWPLSTISTNFMYILIETINHNWFRRSLPGFTILSSSPMSISFSVSRTSKQSNCAHFDKSLIFTWIYWLMQCCTTVYTSNDKDTICIRSVWSFLCFVEHIFPHCIKTKLFENLFIRNKNHSKLIFSFVLVEIHGDISKAISRYYVNWKHVHFSSNLPFHNFCTDYFYSN